MGVSVQPDLDVERLLAPIPDTLDGAGEDPDETSDTRVADLRDAYRRASDGDREQEKKGSEADFGDMNHWQEVARLEAEVLSDVSKDFGTAARLIAASTRAHGLIGLSAGLRVMAGMVEHYWTSGFPKLTGDTWENER